MDKNDIRRNIRARKALLSDSERNSGADSVFAMLEHTAAFMMADSVLLYHSLPDELSTHRFLAKWSAKKRFFLPRVNGIDLEILPYEQTSLRLGAFQIEEPQGTDTYPVDDIDLIVVPGVAYDRSGNRVGRGKGYYDRLLTHSKAVKIGVGYDFQLVDQIDAEPHDVRMDIIITEHSFITITKKH